MVVLDAAARKWVRAREAPNILGPLLASPAVLAGVYKQTKQADPMPFAMDVRRMLPPRMHDFFKDKPNIIQFRLHHSDKRVSFHDSCKAHDGLSSLTQMIESICKHVLASDKKRWKRIEHMLHVAHGMDASCLRFMRIQIEKCINSLRNIRQEIEKDPSFEYESVPVVDWCCGRVNALPEDIEALMELRRVIKTIEGSDQVPIVPPESARALFELPRPADTRDAHFHRPVHK
jgi:hypothetical protein